MPDGGSASGVRLTIPERQVWENTMDEVERVAQILAGAVPDEWIEWERYPKIRPGERRAVLLRKQELEIDLAEQEERSIGPDD